MLTNRIPLERLFNNDRMWYKFDGFDKKGKPKILEVPSGSASYTGDAKHYYFSDDKEELFNYWLGVKNDPKDKYNRKELSVTGKDFIENIINVLQAKGELSFGVGDVFNQELYAKLNDDCKILFYYLFNTDETIGNNEFLAKKFKKLDDLGYYYFFYTKANGEEPFNLAEVFYDYLEVGGEYGWYGNPFYICTNKKLVGRELKVSYLYCNSNAGLPIFSEEYNDTYRFDVNEEKFLENVRHFYRTFEYPDMGHYPTGLDKEEKSLITSIERSIVLNKKALSILKKIHK